MSKKTKKIVILTGVELRNTISRLTCEIIEKVKKLDNLLLVGIPTRGIDLAEVLEKEIFLKTGSKIKKGTIDPTFYRDDQKTVETRLLREFLVSQWELEYLQLELDECQLYFGHLYKKLDQLFPS